MSAKSKQTRLELIAKLQAELKMQESGQFYNYYFAYQELMALRKKNFMASGVIVTITALSGVELVKPFMVRDGFTPETFDALLSEIERSQQIAGQYVIKPKGKGV